MVDMLDLQMLTSASHAQWPHARASNTSAYANVTTLRSLPTVRCDLGERWLARAFLGLCGQADRAGLALRRSALCLTRESDRSTARSRAHRLRECAALRRARL